MVVLGVVDIPQEKAEVEGQCQQDEKREDNFFCIYTGVPEVRAWLLR